MITLVFHLRWTAKLSPEKINGKKLNLHPPHEILLVFFQGKLYQLQANYENNVLFMQTYKIVTFSHWHK